MADSAVARLRGILARDHDAATINQLLAEVYAEWAKNRAQPLRVATAAEAACTITEDPDRNPIYTRSCLMCTYETRPWDNAIAAEDQISDHVSEVHQDVPHA